MEDLDWSRGIVWTMRRKIIEVLLSWQEAGRRFYTQRQMTDCPSLHLADNLDKRNFICFEDSSSLVQRITLNCYRLFFFWTKANQRYTKDTASMIDTLVFVLDFFFLFVFWKLVLYSQHQGMLEAIKRHMEKIIEENKN